ncbi:MAG: sulfurtransferase [Halanaerobium sp.]
MNNKIKFILILIITLSISFSFSIMAAAERDYENPDLLISAEELNEKMEDESEDETENKNENLKIIDVRNSAKYLMGHLPQAVNMWGDDLSNPEGWVDGLIAEPEAFSAVAQAKGINNDSQIIVYDDHNSIWAARLWWIFRVYGHQDVKILEGGYSAWKEEDFETKILPHNPEEGNFVVEDVNNDWIVNSDTIAENLDNEDFIVLDTRSEAEYLGEETNSGAARKGRIPNSIHLEWDQVLNDDYSFKSAAEIEEIYKKRGITKDKELIAPMCHTGVRAAHTFFTLKLMGYDNLKLYDESWVGWSNRSDLPVERK